MPTKTELETEVEQLKAKIAELTTNAVPPPTDAQVEAGNDKVVESLRQEVENLGAQLKLNEAAVQDQGKRIAELESDLSATQRDLDKADSDVLKLEKDLLKQQQANGDLLARLASAAPKPGKLGLVIDGVPHEVVLKGRMQDVVDSYEKNECEDDDLTVVLRKA